MDTDDENLTDWDRRKRREQEWLAGLKPGDQVCIQTSGWNVSYTYAKVEKITRAYGGTIFAKGRRFDTSRGDERPFSARGSRLVEPTQEVADEIEVAHLRRVVEQLTVSSRWQEKLTLEQLRELVPILQRFLEEKGTP